MKRNSLTKGLVISIALSAFLTGCGSTDNSNDKQKSDTSKDVEKTIEKELKATSISGKAIDGYLQFATVCLDLNKDGYCQSTEPMSTTEKDGSFKLDISPKIQKSDGFTEAMLLVYGGRDKDSGTDFRGKLLAPSDATVVNISPITTLIAKAVQRELEEGKKLSKEEIKEKVQASKEQVAKVFGLEVEDLTKDPVEEKENNPKLIKQALKIQKAVEAMNISGDNDALEEVYEQLAEKLEFVEIDQGINDLLDKAFGDDTRRQRAKDINKNIEQAFEKFDGDLTKIAFITKQDMKKIKNNEKIIRDDEDALFKDDIVWEDEYIKADLEEIGVYNPKEYIDKVKNQIHGDIRPGFLFDKKDEFKDSDDSFLNNIYKKFKKDESKKEKKKDQEETKHDSQNIQFKKGMTFYKFDVASYNDGYMKVYFGDDFLTQEYFYQENGAFFKDKESNIVDGDFYILKNNTWTQKDNKTVLKYNIDNNGHAIVGINNELSILNQKDISNTELFVDSIDDVIMMPEGSQMSYISSKQIEDEYALRYKEGDYSTLSKYIEKQCSIGYYVNNDGSQCDADAVSGKIQQRYTMVKSTLEDSYTYSEKNNLKENGWKIKTVDNIEILSEKYGWSENREEKIYSILDGSLYSGKLSKKGVDKELSSYYNKVAIDAIKEAILKYRKENGYSIIE